MILTTGFHSLFSVHSISSCFLDMLSNMSEEALDGCWTTAAPNVSKKLVMEKFLEAKSMPTRNEST